MTEVRAYRLLKRKWKDAAFDGEGARRYGGRWNSRGKSAIYLAGSQSLAMLEVMVHLNDYRLLASYVLFEVRLPADLITDLSDAEIPKDWQAQPAPTSTAEIGDAWFDQNAGLALAVPSVIVPREKNYLLNPRHPLFASVAAHATELRFDPDPRL
ncbi:RES family NAD+ phosphorylase [Thalassospira lucentensis]|uniref:RES family NAD+ phosphorylase n=1 Tax=Thalassospira lucentensis TaxID=168935 RepID=UPI003D2D0438|tara:strand:- start:4667 stop:5131 length:465 start_codon:yes stop_codon:yes gene_type:complete